MEKKTVKALVEKAKTGDAAAFEKLHNEVVRQVFYTCKKALGNEAAAEDVTQDVMVCAFQNLKSLKKPEAFFAWVMKITAFQLANVRKKKKDVLFAGGDEADPTANIAADLAEQPENVTDKKDTAAIIGAIVAGLPVEQRTAVTLHYFSGLGVKDIAQSEGVSVSAIKSRLQYGREKIKAGVKAIEKAQGIQLHSVTAASITAALAAEAANTTAPIAAATVTTAATTATASASSVSAASSAASGLGMSVAAKVVATVLVCVGVAGAGVGAYAIATSEAVTLESVSITAPAEAINAGESMALDFTVDVAVDGSPYNLPGGQPTEGMSEKAAEQVNGFVYEWSTDNAEVATVEGGTVTAQGNGTATLTVTVAHGNTTRSSSASITVQTSVQGVTLLESLELNRGETGSVAATITPDTASNPAVVYESSDPEICTVSASGEVEGIGAGIAQIKASSAENPAIYALCEVTVNVRPESIELSATEAQVQAGRSGQLEITVTPGEDEITVDYDLVASSSDTSVLELAPDGTIITIKGIKAGSATVTVTLSVDGEEIAQATCNVTVTARSTGSGGGSGSGTGGGTGSGGGTGGGTSPGAGDGGGTTPAPQPPPSSNVDAATAAAAALGVGGFASYSSAPGFHGSYAGWSASSFGDQGSANQTAINQAVAYSALKNASTNGTLHAWSDGANFYVAVVFAGDSEVETAW